MVAGTLPTLSAFLGKCRFKENGSSGERERERYAREIEAKRSGNHAKSKIRVKNEEEEFGHDPSDEIPNLGVPSLYIHTHNSYETFDQFVFLNIIEVSKEETYRKYREEKRKRERKDSKKKHGRTLKREDGASFSRFA